MVAQGRPVSPHDLPARMMDSDLRHAVDPPLASAAADTIHRPFFTAAILLVLTFGATWGAWLLWRIGTLGNFTGISVHEINAHGHAQIFGWVGLFIMGIGYQAFARLWQTRLIAPKLAIAVFLAMTAGIILHTIGQGLTGHWSAADPVAIAGGLLELAAILTFSLQILATFRTSRQPITPSVGFIFMALFWFVAMAAMDLWHSHTTMTAPDRESLLWYVSTYQAPLRDMQVHGLSVFMILGVCIHLLPAMYRVPSASARRLWIAFGLLTFAVTAECLIFIAYRWTNLHILAAFLMVPWLLLAIGIAMIVLPWKLWRPFIQADRSAKFIRTAYLWLGISITMLLLLPVYLAVTKIPFSHAYYGSIRHAVTVGFISLMIMGMAAKMVPALGGINPDRLSRLWGPFILINLGCFLRVSTQALTDLHPVFFSIIGLSGILEVIALAWWGTDLILLMYNRKRGRLQPAGLFSSEFRRGFSHTPANEPAGSVSPISSSLR